MVRAQTEELRRIQKHADDERDKLQKEIEKERENLQREREQEKDHFEKERGRLQREREEEKEALHKEVEEIKERLRREKEEEVDRQRKELEVERVRVRSQLDKSIEQVEAERAVVQQKLEEEKKRLVEKAEEDRKRLKEQVRKAIEEVMRRHAAELHSVQEALSSEKKTNQEVRRFFFRLFWDISLLPPFFFICFVRERERRTRTQLFHNVHLYLKFKNSPPLGSEAASSYRLKYFSFSLSQTLDFNYYGYKECKKKKNALRNDFLFHPVTHSCNIKTLLTVCGALGNTEIS